MADSRKGVRRVGNLIDLLSVTQGELSREYTTRLANIEKYQIICFEDETLMGFACALGSPSEMLTVWQALEMSLLRRFAPNLRQAGDKAWNIYLVLLCSLPATADEERAIHWIEEDLSQTRKIAACGIESRDQLVRTLLPILPLQFYPQLVTTDSTDLLRRRIQTIAPNAADAVLNEDVSPDAVAVLLGVTE